MNQQDEGDRMTAEESRRSLRGTLPIGNTCFACGPDNANGLGINYEHVGDSVEATFTLGEEFSGAPNYVHGGIAMTVLDDAMAWSAIAVRGRFSVTTQFTTSFLRPVFVGEEYRVRVTVGELASDGRTLEASGEIVRSDGKPCVKASGQYHALTDEQVEALTESGD